VTGVQTCALPILQENPALSVTLGSVPPQITSGWIFLMSPKPQACIDLDHQRCGDLFFT